MYLYALHYLEGDKPNSSSGTCSVRLPLIQTGSGRGKGDESCRRLTPCRPLEGLAEGRKKICPAVG